MPALSRRRSHDARDECWHVLYGDVRVGMIAVRSGIIANEPNQVEHPPGQIAGEKQ
jgi:hypothetical protein